MNWSEIYYISQGDSIEKHVANIETVLKGGCRLIQLRIKDESIEAIEKAAFAAKELCQQYNAQLFINDHIDVATKVGATGVHLGQGDDEIAQAKASLNASQLIGGTANTLEQCLELAKQKVDYIGLGPYQNTQTKKKLSPILGLEGIKNIIASMKNQGINIPVYAIGGLEKKDFSLLKNAGVAGFALSGALTGTSIQNIENTVAWEQR